MSDSSASPLPIDPSPIDPDVVLIPSPDIVAREIEGELIIVPLTAGVGNLEDELYSMNETGRAIWRRLDGTRSLAEIAAELAVEFEADPAEIESDVVGLAAELLQRGMLVEA